MNREAHLLDAFVGLAHMQTSGRDEVADATLLLRTCLPLLDLPAGLVVLTSIDKGPDLAVIAGDADAIRETLQNRKPTLFDWGRLKPQEKFPVTSGTGYDWIIPFPLQFAEDHVGHLVLFGCGTTNVNERDIRAVDALASTAASAILHRRNETVLETRNRQLQTALDTRLSIEQAKGIIASAGSLEIDAAFEVIRRYARDHKLKLRDVAAKVVSRDLTLTDITR